IRIVVEGHNVIVDIEVKGGVNVKKLYGSEAMSIFIMPPSVGELRNRLESRGTETAEWIEKRVERAELEMGYASQFDRTVVNDSLAEAISEVEMLMKEFMK
ncbi:MAG: guanylate kinase, partial [Duncaniella sp.]|nr:guanylate kinase [Duncaniella sp.]